MTTTQLSTATATKYRRITLDKWQDKYKPINNTLSDNASWQDENGLGIFFETYGEEQAFVFACDYHNVWTLVDGDNGSTYIINGRAIVNRIGYFITPLPWQDNEEFSIKVSS
jgi:hypothetical protein